MDEKYIEAVEWLKEKVRTVDTMLEQDWSQRPETIAKVSKKSEMYQSISQFFDTCTNFNCSKYKDEFMCNKYKQIVTTSYLRSYCSGFLIFIFFTTLLGKCSIVNTF